MILQPLGARIIVKRKKIGKIGSLYVPANSREAKFSLGEVAAAGPHCDMLKEGDMVTFGKYAPMNIDATELEYYGLNRLDDTEDEFLLLNEEDALCIIMREDKEKQ